jgi:pimeloyl-ACP methyl ester carboxylesterase
VIVRVRGVDINVEAEGGGRGDRPTLLMIHGFGASLRTWDPIVPAFGDDYPVVRADLKGFGLSGHPRDGRYSIDENANIVAELVATMRLRRLVLIGHSYGGAVAVMAAASLRSAAARQSGMGEPARLEALVLLDAASYEQRLPFFVEVHRHGLTRWLGLLVPIDAGSRFVLRALVAQKSRVDPAMIERYAFPRRIPGARYSEVQTALQILPASFAAVTRAIQSIDVPTQIIWGDRDPAVPPAFAWRLHDDIPGSRVEVLADVGHLPHEERPDEVIRILSTFLDGLS